MQNDGVSYRHSSALIANSNHLSIAAGTIHDLIHHIGITIRAAADQKRSEIFKEFGFTEKGLPKNIDEAKKRLGITDINAHPSSTELAQAVKRYNDKLKADWLAVPEDRRSPKPPQVKNLSFQSTMERWDGSDDAVKISVDEAVTKKQSEERKQPEHRQRAPRKRKLTPKAAWHRIHLAKTKTESERKERMKFSNRCVPTYDDDARFVSITAVTIKWDGHSQVLTAPSLAEGFENLTAFLLHNGLINRHLVFLIDGASSIQKNIKKYFSCCSCQIVLDWYHVKNQIDSLIGAGTSGTKEERKSFIRQVKSFIWLHDYADALKYIEELKAQHSSPRRREILTKAQNYINNKLPMLTCYGLRKFLKLPNSSNTVERYNGLTVSARQKHNGTSWSRLGSNNEAIIKCASLNGIQMAVLKAANSKNFSVDLFKAAA